MNIQEIKKSLAESRTKKDIFIEYLHALDFFNTKISLKKFLRVIKEVDGFEIQYVYARLIVNKEKELIKNSFSHSTNKLKDLGKPINTTMTGNVENKEIFFTTQNSEIQQNVKTNNESKFKIQDLISMKIEDLPQELQKYATAAIHGYTFDVRRATPSDFNFFGSEDDTFNFAKNMEAKGFLKTSEEYKNEYAKDKLKDKRRKEYREANKEFNRNAKSYIV